MKKLITIVLALSMFCSLNLFAEDEENTESSAIINGKGGYYHEDTGTFSEKPVTEMTPENSVLIYFSIGMDTVLVYTQTNPTKAPMLFYVRGKGAWGSSAMPPVEPGSFLKVIGGSENTYTSKTLFSSELNLYYKQDIQVPSEPGLYYAGVLYGNWNFSSYDDFKESTKGSAGLKKEEKYNETMLKYEQKSLKALQKKYKGTAWEPLINARMEELSK